eukprot:m.234410 g.234410  ORF g.234410 m.234410 type:complete len:111 (-) comp15256_c1_seq11:1378-1710(-)
MSSRCALTPFLILVNCAVNSTMDLYRFVLHCGCNYQMLWSQDGLHWKNNAPQKPWCDVTFSDGTKTTLSRRERPKWVRDANNMIVYISTGVQPNDSIHGGRTFTMLERVV